MNKKTTSTIVIVLAALIIGCKEKNKVQTAIFVPDRSDYIITASTTFITANDSAAKITARYILDENKFKINYDALAEQLFSIYKSLDRGAYVLAFDDQVRFITSEIIKDLHITTAGMMKVKESEFPLDFIQRNIMTQKYLEPNLDSIQRFIAANALKNFKGTRAEALWIDMIEMQNRYYNTSINPSFNFNTIARDAALQFTKNVKTQDDSAKKYYGLWQNKRAIETMDYLKK